MRIAELTGGDTRGELVDTHTSQMYLEELMESRGRCEELQSQVARLELRLEAQEITEKENERNYRQELENQVSDLGL